MNLANKLRRALTDGHERDIDILLSDTRDPRIDGDMVLAPAAVLVAVTDRAEPGLILTERSASLRKHAGQIAFPGGRVDESDQDEIAAALREAQEEIGLPPHMVDIIGMSDRYHSFTGFDIVPVLGVIPPDIPLVLQQKEVADWFEMPLSYALDPANRSRKTIVFEGIDRHFYEIIWEGRRVWGVTAAIIANLSRRLEHGRLAA